VQTMSPVDIALIDPQRRDKNRKGKYRLDECTPDIAALLPHIKAKTILLKTSPMLDIDQSVQTLKHVQHVHVMQWRGECKEVVYVLTPQAPPNDAPAMTAVTLNDEGTQTHALTFTRLQEGETIAETAAPLRYLYEPGPAFLKAGCYKTLSLHYHAAKLHPHTHLYTSDTKIPDFPGRCFDIKGVYPANAKALPVTKANLAVRNFPQNIDILKKKLKLKDGGDDYLFACTLNNEKHVIIHTHKVNMDNS
ncbi:MAG: THUMP-like domain-containing protein, partial [Bdellovibrionales bacterium]